MSELDMTKAALEAANEYIQTVQAELSTLRATLDREREATSALEKELSYLSDKSAELESTLAEVYEKVDKLEGDYDEVVGAYNPLQERTDFYRWFFELTNAQSREDLEEMYGEELPEGVNV